eukprot:gene5915-7364_t
MKISNQIEFDRYQYQSFLQYFRDTIINQSLSDKCAIKVVDCNSIVRQSLSYHKLDVYSNYLSILINNSNGGHDSNDVEEKKSRGIFIGVWLPHSPDLIISLLSIWKSHCIYVPLDTSFPIDRIKYMTSHSELSIIITNHQNHNDESVKQFPNTKILCCDCIFKGKTVFDIEKNNQYTTGFKVLNNPFNPPEHPAYLIYTSGSTGNPKGVLVAHRGIVNFLKFQIHKFGFSKRSIILQSLPICFDASISEIGTSLLSGSTLIIPSTQEDAKIIRGSNESFINFLTRNQVSQVIISPSYLSQLNPTNLYKGLKTIIIGGEVCPQSVIDNWTNYVNIVNIYGPTEATVCTTAFSFYQKLNTRMNTKNQSLPNSNILLGDVVPFMMVYVLNQDGKRISVGEEGEIYISGVGVALEYFKDPELTKQSFLNDPFRKGFKMFKTGDWAKLCPGNKIEFRGRIDNQIKLHGSRIELEEISRTLEEHPLIFQSVVDLKTVNNEKQLVAYLIFKNQMSCTLSSTTPLQDQFKSFLKQKLPDFMVPNHFVILDKFPQNSNEKIDKSKLPLPTNNSTLLIHTNINIDENNETNNHVNSTIPSPIYNNKKVI